MDENDLCSIPKDQGRTREQSTVCTGTEVSSNAEEHLCNTLSIHLSVWEENM